MVRKKHVIVMVLKVLTALFIFSEVMKMQKASISSSWDKNVFIKKNSTHKLLLNLMAYAGKNTTTEKMLTVDNSSVAQVKPPKGTILVEETRASPLKVITAVMFSTWVRSTEKQQIRLSTLNTWHLWAPGIMPVVFTDDDVIRQDARAHGWRFQGEPKKACSGVPLYREMFREAIKTHDSDFYGFVNGDILVSNGLLPSLRAVAKLAAVDTKPVMVIFRRTNVDFTNRPTMDNVDNLEEIAKEGRPVTGGSSDGIFTNRLFPWDHVPDIVPGRYGIDMWMVSYAREIGADVIDVSETAVAVHMTTQAGNRESSRHNDSQCNHRIYNAMGIRPRSWLCGFVRCTAYKTVKVTINNVKEIRVVDKRAINSKRCGECNMNLKPLMDTVF